MEPLAFGFITLAFMGLALFLNKSRADSRRRSWAQLAERLQLEMIPGGTFAYPSLSGRYRGLEVTVDVELRGGKNKVPYTRLRASVLPHVPYDVALYPQGFLQGVARLFGMQDIEVDDPEFDDRVVVQAKDIEQVRQLLSSARLRRALVAVFGEYTQARIDDGEAWLIRRGFTEDERFLTRDLDQLVDLCATLRAAATGAPEMEPAIAQVLHERERMTPEEWLTRNTRLPQPRVMHVDAEGQPVHAEPDEAAEPLDRLIEHTPGPSALEPVESPTTPSPSDSRKIEPAPPRQREVDLATLMRLSERSLGGRELDAALEAVTGCLLSVADQEIREVRRSSAFDGAEAYRGGQMAVLRVEGWPELAFRFKKDDPEGAALKRGGRLSAEGVIVSWERLYRRLVVEVDSVR